MVEKIDHTIAPISMTTNWSETTRVSTKLKPMRIGQQKDSGFFWPAVQDVSDLSSPVSSSLSL
jgi:hypothetical protein